MACSSIRSGTALALLGGCQFTVYTYHDAPKRILNPPNSTGKLVLCRLQLFELEIDVVHHAGVMHQAAHALSRLKTAGTHQTPI